MITIPTADLVGVISDVLPFASPDKDWPERWAVNIEWDGEQLHAFATDGYRLGWSRWEPGDVGEDEEVQDDLFTQWGSGDAPWSITLQLADATELAKVFKLPTKEWQTPLIVDYTGDRIKVRRDRDKKHSAITVVADAAGVAFPDVRVLLAKADKATRVARMSYSAKWLADFAKVRPRGPMQLHFTKNLTRVSIGERFTGAIVPADKVEEE